MATVVITPPVLTPAGVAAADTAATAGNTYTIDNSKPIVLRIHNAGGSTAHATIKGASIPSERKGVDKTVTVAAGADSFVGDIDPNLFGTTIKVTVDAALSVAAFQLPLAQRRNP